MPFRCALIGLTVLALLAFSATAQQTAPTPSDPALGLKLRLQESLLPPAAAGPEEDLPIFVEADRLEGTQGKEIRADGDVVLRRRGEALFADQLRYLFPTQEVTAIGHVRLDRLGDILTGDRAYFNLSSESGNIERPSYRFRQYHARGEAKELKIRDRDRYRATKATYTNCDVGDDDWYLKVQRLDLDRLTDVGEAHNATVYFKQVPILYTPWLDFPLSSRRKTGLLPPTWGSTASSGFEVSTPFYWNIRPDTDDTVTPRLLARRGLQLGNEFRYLRPNYAGQLQVEYLPDDRIKQETRYALFLRHNQNFGSGFSGALNIQRVSDSTYFTDLSDRIAFTSQSVLPQEGWLKYEGGWWTSTFRYQRFQTLQPDPLTPITPPYSRSPQVTLLASQENVIGFDMGFAGELVNFEHPSLLSGRRQIYYPYLTFPVRTPLFYITPKAGFNYTQYSFPDTTRASADRGLPIFSVESGMEFERDTQLLGRDFVQTLEPKLYYLYIPFVDQTQLPVFDTALKDFNFTSLFSENKFSGGDRINDADQVTAAVITRLINPISGAEMIRAAIGQRYYFKPQQVTLDSALPTPLVPSNVEPSTAARSDLLAAFSGQVTRDWSVDSGLQYGVDTAEMDVFDAGVRYQPEPGKVLNFGYRYTRDFLKQVDLSAQWPLSRRWAAVGRWNYSLQDSAPLESLAGFEYNAGCWAARFVLHRFVTATQERTSAFFFQLELSGLSRIGSSPLELLRQGIGGYTRPSLRPTGAGPYYPGMDEQ